MAKAKKRASKARAAKKDSARTEPAVPSDVIKVPSEPKLKALLRACKGADADRNEATGRKGSLISNAVDKDHLDKRAWAWVAALERMSQQKGATTWAHLQHYVEALGLAERFDQQEEMFAKPEVGEEAETAPETAPETAKPGGNGKPAPRPGSFAAKMQEQQAEQARSLTNPKHVATADQAKEIADRAEGTTH